MRAARYENESVIDFDALNEAFEVVNLYRGSHQEPMTKVRNGLGSMVNTIGEDLIITQRLKRTPGSSASSNGRCGLPMGGWDWSASRTSAGSV